VQQPYLDLHRLRALDLLQCRLRLLLLPAVWGAVLQMQILNHRYCLLLLLNLYAGALQAGLCLHHLLLLLPPPAPAAAAVAAAATAATFCVLLCWGRPLLAHQLLLLVCWCLAGVRNLLLPAGMP
jgi:hypothetical protein